MIDQWLAISLAIGYLSLLFVIGYFGERFFHSQKARPWIYSLSLAVYCTSWAMFGTVAQSQSTGWFVAPTYVGTILVFVLAWPLLYRIIVLSKANNVTSIADFIASRFGQSHFLGGLVVLICVIAVTPYISLQIKAIVNSFLTISNPASQLKLTSSNYQLLDDIGFYTIFILAFFTIIFGTRKINATESQPGVMLAVAFESLVKLTAFLMIGVFCVYFLFDGFSDLWDKANNNAQTKALLYDREDSSIYLTQVFLGALAIICLPRQFHVLVVENRTKEEFLKSRWIFPLYLMAINLFMLPIALAGTITIGNDIISAENYSLVLPMLAEQSWLSLVVFIGGISAATSMIIVATLVLSTMISNEIIIPFAVKFFSFKLKQTGEDNSASLGHLLQNTRRVLILVILFLSFLFYKTVSANEALSTTGLISMALVAQLAPAIVLGIYWRACKRKAVISGLIAGLFLWFYTLLIPMLESAQIMSSNIVEHGLFGISLLKPTSLFGLYGFDTLTHGLIWSFGINLFLVVYLSNKQPISIKEQLETKHFLHSSQLSKNNPARYMVNADDLFALCSRFIGLNKARIEFQAFCEKNNLSDIDQANIDSLIDFAQNLLQAIIGATSTRLIFESLNKNSNIALDEVVDMIDEATEVLTFNRELLQSAVENISQGISVVDKDLRLVAWNKHYQKLFQYPDELLQVGRPIEDLIRYNAKQGKLRNIDHEDAIQKRLNFMKVGSPYVYERKHDDGLILELKGTPMPGGGFVTSFIDITEFRKQQEALQNINQKLEERVSKRTTQLQSLNEKFLQAKSAAELANHSKTRFLAAASHDVLQPLNAASLYSAALSEKLSNLDDKKLTESIQQSLQSAEQLLKDLIEISKLDSGSLPSSPSLFSLDELMRQLHSEFAVIAKSRKITLKTIVTRKVIYADRTLTRRLFQNLLANAIKHSLSDRIIFGCRHHSSSIAVHIIDRGVGIEKSKQTEIFEEFVQLDSDKLAIEGHGLGLAIVSRITKLMGVRVNLRSESGKGCDFSVSFPVIDSKQEPSALPAPVTHQLLIPTPIKRGQILCIDNEPEILKAMDALLTSWGIRDFLTSSNGAFEHHKEYRLEKVALIIADYHLENDKTGIELIKKLRLASGWDIPAIVITADQSEAVKQIVQENSAFLLNKPVKPLQLRSLINRLLQN